MNIYFYPDTKSKAGKASLYLIVKGKNFKTIKKALFKIHPDLWDHEAAKLKPKHPGALQLNGFINRIKADFMAETPKFLTASEKEETVRNWISAITGQNSSNEVSTIDQEEVDQVSTEEVQQVKDLMDIAAEFMASKRPVSAVNTMKSFRLLFKMLKDFQKEKKVVLTIDGFDRKLFEKLRDWMMQKEFLNNTLNKRFTMLKTFLNWADEHGYPVHADKRFFSFRADEVENIALTKDEVMMLINFDFSEKPHLDSIRDVFVVGCLTGVRYSDLRAFRHEDFDGETWRLRTTKTKDPIQIPILQPVAKILDKYKDQGQLPVLHNQPFNRELKDMAKMAGITGEFKKVHYSGSQRIETVKQRWELVSSHTARRTFITVSIHAGLEDSLIMKIAGIKNYATLNKYLKVTKDDKAKAVAKVWGEE